MIDAATLQAMRAASARKPHGTRARYATGCKCSPCRAANTAYERMRLRARREGDWNGIVDASKARAHLKRLSRLGVGRHSVWAASDVPDSTLYKIITGEKPRIRARTERRILAVDEGARAGAAVVAAGRTWRRINHLLREGFTKTWIARQLGNKIPALQIRRDRVLWRTETNIERLYRRVELGA